ncbi:MAG: glycosyltransferase [Candidatus Aenigmarchaeota archaeon]|nr:glycosyltransferase [Candidatus Aenigmarchaeota archaeon]
MKKTIIIPAYNEEDGIKEVITRVKKVCSDGDEIIVVDDGSRDRTKEIAKRMGVRILVHKTNKGKAIALKTGYRAAKNDVVVTIDADCTYPPEEIPNLVKNMDGYDLVVGSRFKNGIPEGLSLLRGLTNIMGAFYASFILFKRVTDVTTGMRAFRKNVVEACKIRARGLDFEAEFTSRAITMGFRYNEIPINADERIGRSKLKFFRDTFKFAIAILRGRLR